MKRILWRVALLLVGVLLLAILCGGAWLRWRLRASLPVLDGAITVPGLSGRVEVLRDARGVPHIRAQSLADALFAQGYVTAQDRLWQMDLSRRNAEGELSEVFGNRTLNLDIQSRTLTFPRVAENALADLSADERLLLAAYTRGVNAFIDSHGDRLPFEFLLLRYQPKPWRDVDSVAVALNLAAALSQNWESDVMREHIAPKLGKEFFADAFPDHSPLDVPVAEVPPSATVAASDSLYPNHACARTTSFDNSFAAPPRRPGRHPSSSEEGSSKGSPPDSGGVAPEAPGWLPEPWVLGWLPAPWAPSRYTYAARPLGFYRKDVETQQASSAGLGPNAVRPYGDRPWWMADRENIQSQITNHQSTIDGLGSNNWVVNGSHTRSGKPLLANDPHLGHSVPSIWYMVHLKAPGLDVTGVSLPGLPLVIIGHNEHIAWGMTNTAPDVQDLYIEKFNPREPGRYLHNGRWEDAEVRDETIKVRRQPDYHLTVNVTRHGPIIARSAHRDLALQWTLLSPHALRLPFFAINQASNWQEFTAALRGFKVPMQNVVYADAEGNIGFYAAGLVPIRKQGNGSVPVPGDTDDYDWTGFIPFDALPHAFNPPSGIIATANGRIVPDNYPYFLTARWDAPFRTARIFQLLRAGRDFAPADMLRIQTDILSAEDMWLAQLLLAAAGKQPPSNSDAQFALASVKAWDGIARADSAATLVLEVTRHALLARILKPKLGAGFSGYRWPMSTTFLQNVLAQNLTRWLPPGDADFNETLMKSLEEGVQQIPALVHSRNHAAWRWGDTIPLTFHHPLSSGMPLAGRWLDVGPFPQAGTGTTVKQTTPRLGPSMRMVVDFSNLDQSLQNITLGESGQVSSPYYRDQVSAWYNGNSFPMLFSDAAVEKGAVHKLVLEAGK